MDVLSNPRGHAQYEESQRSDQRPERESPFLFTDERAIEHYADTLID
jgi:hypothetical protein